MITYDFDDKDNQSSIRYLLKSRGEMWKIIIQHMHSL